MRTANYMWHNENVGIESGIACPQTLLNVYKVEPTCVRQRRVTGLPPQMDSLSSVLLCMYLAHDSLSVRLFCVPAWLDSQTFTERIVS